MLISKKGNDEKGSRRIPGGGTVRELSRDKEIALDFGTIIDKYLYLDTRTPGQKFEIRLAECDISQAKGITIGLKTLAGK